MPPFSRGARLLYPEISNLKRLVIVVDDQKSSIEEGLGNLSRLPCLRGLVSVTETITILLLSSALALELVRKLYVNA